MTALAGLLHESGCRVTGSDQRLYPPTSTLLAAMELTVFEGFDPARLEPPPDLVVVGNAISRGNPEIEEVLDRRLAYASMPRVIADRFLAGRHSVVVAGTHGKTTTTSMLAWVLERAGRDPGYLIGGAPLGFERPFREGRGPFVIEGDEYDTAFFDKGPKFMHYRPDTVVLGAVEFDHADIYRDLEEVCRAFRRLVRLVPRRGLLVHDADSPVVREIAAEAPCRAVGFGLEAGSWRAVGARETERGACFAIERDGAPFAEVGMLVSGRHNVRNALSACIAAHDLGLTADEIAAGLGTFPGVRRRLELRGDPGGIRVYDDFAHHPTAVALTVETVRRRHPDRRVWAVLEPRSWSMRRNVFQERLVASFDGADRAIVAGVFGAEALAPAERLDPERVVRDLRGRGIDADFGPTADDVLDRLLREARPGDVIVLMSNGGFGGLPARLVDALARREGAR